jgi:hypothetical protein
LSHAFERKEGSEEKEGMDGWRREGMGRRNGRQRVWNTKSNDKGSAEERERETKVVVVVVFVF